MSKGGLEPGNPRIFPDSALEYAGGGEIPVAFSLATAWLRSCFMLHERDFAVFLPHALTPE